VEHREGWSRVVPILAASVKVTMCSWITRSSNASTQRRQALDNAVSIAKASETCPSSAPPILLKPLILFGEMPLQGR
jgi:hypothetical protein